MVGSFGAISNSWDSDDGRVSQGLLSTSCASNRVGKSRQHADVVTRNEPANLRGKRDPICAVCRNTTDAMHTVTTDHGHIVHADCWEKSPVRRVLPLQRLA